MQPLHMPNAHHRHCRMPLHSTALPCDAIVTPHDDIVPPRDAVMLPLNVTTYATFYSKHF